ncbi:hypothetical protein CYLTODRAFT_494755 [Cylindrobasidium torrendii FP15055 ss-10]|uniref:RED-like N-terminal domain-containing protein n=1 Tax=Cylindrobasidium torrendii FP15055 ss-10 TaxID=1314674 RepID=A0A0D7AV56_9AGAR|nr:hypothetical protein CYLTODRAFT_494755 [Cylindrobasidium torrendii FP15055 ss-10]
MDQDAFRTLLSKPSAGLHTKKAQPTISASEPAFKPRKVKGKDGKYRDRAEERRIGAPGEHSALEAMLAELDGRQDLDDEKRKLLGGDSEHTVLVKGLDLALLEQNKAKAAISVTADEDLEEAFAEMPKKRTREDIVRELKEKRGHIVTPSTEPSQPTTSKFKPVGFKPVGASEDAAKKKKKKAKTPADGEPKKKKRKVAVIAEAGPSQTKAVEQPIVVASQPSPPPAEPEPVDDDLDIFADAGDYDGLNMDDADDDDVDEGHHSDGELRQAPDEGIAQPIVRGHWFGDERSPSPAPERPSALSIPSSSAADPVVEEGEVAPLRLQGLDGSMSVKEMLALDQEAARDEKRRKRKEKSKKKKKDNDDDD